MLSKSKCKKPVIKDGDSLSNPLLAGLTTGPEQEQAQEEQQQEQEESKESKEVEEEEKEEEEEEVEEEEKEEEEEEEEEEVEEEEQQEEHEIVTAGVQSTDDGKNQRPPRLIMPARIGRGSVTITTPMEGDKTNHNRQSPLLKAVEVHSPRKKQLHTPSNGNETHSPRKSCSHTPIHENLATTKSIIVIMDNYIKDNNLRNENLTPEQEFQCFLKHVTDLSLCTDTYEDEDQAEHDETNSTSSNTSSNTSRKFLSQLQEAKNYPEQVNTIGEHLNKSIMHLTPKQEQAANDSPTQPEAPEQTLKPEHAEIILGNWLALSTSTPPNLNNDATYSQENTPNIRILTLSAQDILTNFFIAIENFCMELSAGKITQDVETRALRLIKINSERDANLNDATSVDSKLSEPIFSTITPKHIIMGSAFYLFVCTAMSYKALNDLVFENFNFTRTETNLLEPTASFSNMVVNSVILTRHIFVVMAIDIFTNLGNESRWMNNPLVNILKKLETLVYIAISVYARLNEVDTLQVATPNNSGPYIYPTIALRMLGLLQALDTYRPISTIILFLRSKIKCTELSSSNFLPSCANISSLTTIDRSDIGKAFLKLLEGIVFTGTPIIYSSNATNKIIKKFLSYFSDHKTENISYNYGVFLYMTAMTPLCSFYILWTHMCTNLKINPKNTTGLKKFARLALIIVAALLTITSAIAVAGKDKGDDSITPDYILINHAIDTLLENNGLENYGDGIYTVIDAFAGLLLNLVATAGIIDTIIMIIAILWKKGPQGINFYILLPTNDPRVVNMEIIDSIRYLMLLNRPDSCCEPPANLDRNENEQDYSTQREELSPEGKQTQPGTGLTSKPADENVNDNKIAQCLGEGNTAQHKPSPKRPASNPNLGATSGPSNTSATRKERLYSTNSAFDGTLDISDSAYSAASLDKTGRDDQRSVGGPQEVTIDVEGLDRSEADSPECGDGAQHNGSVGSADSANIGGNKSQKDRESALADASLLTTTNHGGPGSAEKDNVAISVDLNDGDDETTEEDKGKTHGDYVALGPEPTDPQNNSGDTQRRDSNQRHKNCVMM